jgi:hypothetical protein
MIGIVAAATFNSFRGIGGIIVSVIILGLAVVAAYYAYMFAASQGLIDTMGADTFSSDLDNLTPVESDTLRKLSPETLVSNFAQGEHWFKGGNLKVWDDYKKRQLDQYSDIANIHYDPSEHLLTIDFKNQNQLCVWHPDKIYETSTYLKVISASKVVWKWGYKYQHEYYFEYVLQDKKIVTNTNVNWKVGIYDLSVAHPAVIILGKL